MSQPMATGEIKGVSIGAESDQSNSRQRPELSGQDECRYEQVKELDESDLPVCANPSARFAGKCRTTRAL
jgi:hypothetical protein